MVGQILNERYRLEAELGQGGMGVVYRAHDMLLDRDVAAKVLSKSNLGTQGRARLLREAQSAARLNHPNIVAVYDAGEADGLSFIVMELVEGESLYKRGSQDLAETLAIARQICAALDHAHAHGIVHRDLKPENVLVAPDGSVKLTDFGLARSAASRISTEGALVGTVFYMAPEQAMGEPFDGRADLYALGVMLYELTAGRLPFTADDPLAVISQHLYAPAVPPRTLRPDLPQALEAIILKLLSKSAADRFASAREVAQALAQVEQLLSHPAPAEGEPVEASLLDQLGRGRMVGRQVELNQLRELWQRAQQGQGHLALISGEPGVGKTRLANEMLVLARLKGAVVLQGGCYEYEAATPYLPFVEAIRQWVHVQSRDVLAERLYSTAAELAKLAPEIEARLGPLSPNPPLPPNEERLRLFDHVTRFFQRLAAGRGLLLFLDDLHWADQGTLALLHYLLRALRQDRVLILACYREVELDRTHPLATALVEWYRERLASRLPLARLSLDETAAMLAVLFGQISIMTEMAEPIYRETEGNPFFVEEVVKSLIEQGQIYREAGRWERKAIAELAIPQSVKEAIGRRLNRLTEPCLDVLHTASALGKSFAFAELAAVATAGEDQLLDALDEASAAQLVSAEKDEAFSFTHDKIREVLHEEQNPIRRRRLHQHIGEGLEKLYAGDLDPHVQDLAHHFVESGDLLKGLRYSMQAAEQAERLFAHDEALSYYGRAVECAEALNLAEQLAAIYEAIGQVYSQRGPFQSAVDAFQKAMLRATAGKRAELKTRIGATYATFGDERGVLFLQEALRELNPDTQASLLAQATAMLGRFHHYRRQFDEATEYLERARELAEPLDDAETLTQIYGYLAGLYQQKDWRFERSMEWARRSIELGERKNYPHAVALGYEFLAEDSYGMGQWQAALAFAERDREIGQKIGAQGRVAWAENSFAYCYHGLGDLAAALNAINTAIALAERIGDNRLAVMVRAKRASIATDLGDDQSAQSDMDWALARTRETGHKQMYMWTYGALGYIYWQREDWERALDVCAEQQRELGYRPEAVYVAACLGLGRLEELTRATEDKSPERWEDWPLQWQAERWAMQAQVLTAQGAWDEAAGRFEQAIAAFKELNSRLALARTIYQRGLLCQARGDMAGAQDDFTHALVMFEAMGAQRDAGKAQARLS